jgi:transcriptional regulator GlxA family with amidase domain
VAWLRDNYKEPLSVDELADRVHMAPSTFYRHFKTVMNLSPLQYHKLLRLHEARRLMIVKQMDAATAAYSVGYVSPTQFSREYKRLFGTSPKKSVAQMRS